MTSPRRPGRYPRLGRGEPIGAWRDSGALWRYLTHARIVGPGKERLIGSRKARRDEDDVTRAHSALCRLARRLLSREITPAEVRRLKQLAVAGRPHEIERVLLQWKFGVSYDDIRRLKTGRVEKMIWR